MSAWLTSKRQIDERVSMNLLEEVSMASDLTDLFEQSSLYCRWVSEAQAKGHEQGLQQGQQAGLQQGRQHGEEHGKHEGLAPALRIVIERRFGPLTKEVTLALAAGDIATLENATPIAATGSPEDVRAVLGL